MGSYKVELQGGGDMTVNASSPEAARENVEASGNTPKSGSSATNMNPGGTPTGGGGGGGGGGDAGAIAAGFAASSGFSIKQLNEQIRQFDAELDWKKKMWEQQGLPQLVIQQRVQDLEEAKFAELTAQANRQQSWVEKIGQQQQDLAREVQTGRLGLDTELGRGNLGVSQGQLKLSEKEQAEMSANRQKQLELAQSGQGLDVLKAQASLSGPSDWIKAANFARGVQSGGGNLPAFVGQLLGGQSTAAMGGATPGMQMSDALSLQNMAQRMGVEGAGAAGNQIQGQPFTAGMGMPQGGGDEMARRAAMEQQMQQQWAAAQGQAGAMAPTAGAPVAAPLTEADRQAQMQQMMAASQAAQQGMQGQMRTMELTPEQYAAAGIRQGQTMNEEQLRQQALGGQSQRMYDQYRQQMNPAAQAQAAVQGQNLNEEQMQAYMQNAQRAQQASSPWAQAAGGNDQAQSQLNTGARMGATGPASPTMGSRQNDTTAAENQMRRLFGGGGHALGAQALEGLSETEMKMMAGGGESIGADVPGFMKQYQTSRIGQKSSSPGSF